MALQALPSTWDGGYVAGPYLGANGHVYILSRDDSGNIGILKTTAPGSSAFTEQDGSNRPTVTGTTAFLDVKAFWDRAADVVWVIAWSDTVPAMGDPTYYLDVWSFSMASDAWTKTGGPRGNIHSYTSGAVSLAPKIMLRTFDSGTNQFDLAVIFSGADAADMGSAFRTTYHMWYDSAAGTPAWTTPTRIDSSTGGVHYDPSSISTDVTSSGNYAVEWAAVGSGPEARMMFGSTHSAGAIGAVGTGSVTGPVDGKFHVAYNDGGTWRGTLVQMGGTTSANGIRYDPTNATPFASETEESDITGAINIYSAEILGAYDPDTDIRYAIYVNNSSTGQIRTVESDNEASWGNDTVRRTVTSGIVHLQWHGAAIYTRSGTKLLAYCYYDSNEGLGYYDEISLASGDTNVNANTETLSLATHAATVNAETNVLANVETLSLATHPATITLTVNVAAGTAALELATLPANVNAETNVLAGVETLGLTTHAATVNAERNVEAATETLELATLAADVNLDRFVAAGTAALSLVTNPATVNAETNVQAGTAALTLATFPADVSLGKVVDAGTAALSLVTHAADVNLDKLVDAGTAALTLATQPADVNLDRNVAAGVATLTLGTLPAGVNAETNVLAGTAVLTLATYPASIGGSTNIAATTATLTLATYAAGVNAETNVLAATETLSLGTLAADVNLDRFVAVGVAGLTLATYPATIEVGGATNVNATTATLELATYPATVNAERNVLAGTAALMLSTSSAQIGLDRDVAAATAALVLNTYPAIVELGGATIAAGVARLELATYAATILAVQLGENPGTVVGLEGSAVTSAELTGAADVDGTLSGRADVSGTLEGQR